MKRNQTQFLDLIKRYETITIEEIRKEWRKQDGNCKFVAKALTGFGYPSTCTLCKSSKSLEDFPWRRDCIECVYGSGFGCMIGTASETYRQIEQAKKPLKLLKAYRERAKYMKTLL